jgi:hypothetical protein
MRNILINNLINSIENNSVILNHKYDNFIEIEHKNGAQIFNSVKLTIDNVNNYVIKTGLRGYLLIEWIKQGNECLIKYNQILKPGKNAFDNNLLEYFTSDELELIDYKFFGKKLYNLDQHSFNLLIDSLNYILEFCKKIINDEKINGLKNIDNIYDYEDDMLLLTNGTAFNNLYGYIDLKTRVSGNHLKRKDFNKMLGLDILKNL